MLPKSYIFVEKSILIFSQNMKNILKLKELTFICLIICTFSHSNATECVGKTFEFKNFDFYLCQNYSEYKYIYDLLYEARAKQLNNIIENLKKQGRLKNKKIYLEVMSPDFGKAETQVFEDSNTYYIQAYNYPNLHKLAHIFYDLAQIKPIPKTLDLPVNTLWELDDIKLQYQHDELYYYHHSKLLKYKPESNLPIKMKDVFLFFDSDSIFVYRKNEEIQSFKITEYVSEDFVIDKNENQVVLKNHWLLNCHYVYDYEKNEFKIEANSHK
jgi:hypothetical protein